MNGNPAARRGPGWFWLLALAAPIVAAPASALPAALGAPGRIPTVTLTPIDAAAARAAAAKAAADGRAVPLRFARPSPVTVTPKIDGTWTTVPGGRRWRLRVRVPGATDLNLGFDRFHLPAGAGLVVASEDPLQPGYVAGPFTGQDAHQGELWTAPLPGESVVLSLFLPTGTRDELDLRLAHVGAGFRDVFQLRGGPGLKGQGACNIDVTCPEGTAWRDPVRAVAAYSLGGANVCTGTLLMDAEGTFTPWFLTAYHCRVTPANDQSVVTLWNFEAPTCGALGGGSRTDSVSGATVVARREDVDVALLELASTPPIGYDVHYAGWDRSGLTPLGAVGIHHPQGEEKAISFAVDPLTRGENCILAAPRSRDTHWYVDGWELGTTEPGSSGSALFEPDGQRVVGMLSGGRASCARPDAFDCYGRFGIAWAGGLSGTERLAPWLDPAGLGPTVVDGADPAPFRLELRDRGVRVCPGRPAPTEVKVVARDPTVALGEIDLSPLATPAGVSFTFDVARLAPGATTAVQVAVDEGTPAGTRPASILGTAAAGADAARLQVTVSAAVAGPPELTFPAAGARAVSPVAELRWSGVAGASRYRVEIARDPGFEALVRTATVTGTRYRPSPALESDQTYYWRVEAANECPDTALSVARRFTTGLAFCQAPDRTIPDDGVAFDRLAVSTDGILEALAVYLVVEHTAVGDLFVSLERAATGTAVVLLDRPGTTTVAGGGCPESDVDAEFTDAAGLSAEDTCGPAPALAGALRPSEPLAAFAGGELAGAWRLTVADRLPLDAGRLVRWCLLPRLTGRPGPIVFRDGFEAPPAPRGR